MSKSVSIVIPVFNSATTIDATLTSISNEIEIRPDIQWQVLAIDDGSADNSLEILNSWIAKLPLIVSMIPPSGNPAKPRNHGMSMATGEYLFFLDADDVLLPNGISGALDFAYRNSSDVVVCKLKSLDGRGTPRGMHHGNQADVGLTSSRIYWSLNPMKLIRRELVLDNDLKFATGMGRDEDQPFIFSAYLKSNTISVFSEPPVVGIRYTNSESNLTLRPYPVEDLIKYLKVMSTLLAEIKNPTDRLNLAIRHWEIEISREMFWKRMHRNSDADFSTLMSFLEIFAQDFYNKNLLPRTSIRWRSIVRLINNNNRVQLKKLIALRGSAMNADGIITRKFAAIQANLIRCRFTFLD